MTFYNLYLDDIRHPSDSGNYMDFPVKHLYREHDWVIVRNYDEFVTCIASRFNKHEFPRLVSFDHDLADAHYSYDWEDADDIHASEHLQEKTGNDCAKWLVAFCGKHHIGLPNFLVHSMNHIGAENIKNTLKIPHEPWSLLDSMISTD